MKGSRSLRGRIKHFWIFMAVVSVVAFVSNYSVQVLTRGEADIQGAVTTSVIVGLVIAIIMASRVSRKPC